MTTNHLYPFTYHTKQPNDFQFWIRGTGSFYDGHNKPRLSEEEEIYLKNNYIPDEHAWLQLVISKAPELAGILTSVMHNFSVVIVQNSDKHRLSNIPACFMVTQAGMFVQSWEIRFRYRTDVPWHIVIMPGEFTGEMLDDSPAILLFHAKKLRKLVTQGEFASGLMRLLMRILPPFWFPLESFVIHAMQYVKESEWKETHRALAQVDFFFKEEPREYDYALERETSSAAWEECINILTSLKPPAFRHAANNGKTLQFWNTIRYERGTVLLCARSRIFPVPEEGESKLSTASLPTILGFALAGIHPHHQSPWLYYAAVLPDERRRGIGTSLLKRLFAQTGWRELSTRLMFSEGYEPFEAASFLKSMGAVIKSKEAHVWDFNVPSPNTRIKAGI